MTAWNDLTINRIKLVFRKANKCKPKYLSAWYDYVYKHANNTRAVSRKIDKLKVYRIEVDHETRIVKAYVKYPQ